MKKIIWIIIAIVIVAVVLLLVNGGNDEKKVEKLLAEADEIHKNLENKFAESFDDVEKEVKSLKKIYEKILKLDEDNEEALENLKLIAQLEGMDKLSIEAQSAIAAIRSAYRVYYQIYGTTEGYSLEEALKDANMGNDVKKNWEFEVIGDPPVKYIATSTSEAPIGFGQQVWFDVEESAYHGFGIDNKENNF